jgi:hypothetical protein
LWLVKEEGIRHQHPHGGHLHVHSHPGGDQQHYHGWHAEASICRGDDTFGEEEGMPREPNLKEPELLRIDDEKHLVVVMPYVGGMDDPRVIERVLSQPCTVVRQDVSTTQFDYWELTRQLWESGQDWAYVEHDVLIPPGCIAGLEACPEVWCMHSYTVQDDKPITDWGGNGAFGMVRFRGELTRKFSTLVADLFHHSWSRLDGQVISALFARGYKAHQHYPDAEHLHVYDGHQEQRRQAGSGPSRVL